MHDLDGSILLTTDAVADVLMAAVNHAGGRMLSWQLDHVDAAPNHSTTATYYADVQWPHGRTTELLGVSARVGPPVPADANAMTFADGDREVVVWLYPRDPDLPGLVRATYPEQMAALINEHQLVGAQVRASDISLEMIGYRPRRRAVVKLGVHSPPRVFYVKVVRENVFEDLRRKHAMLLEAGVPAPEVAAATHDSLLVLKALPGKPLAKAIFGAEYPCGAQDFIDVLDHFPADVTKLPRRPPWSDSIAHYASIVSAAMPSQERRLNWLVDQISSGLKGLPPGSEATHGDFHEGQLHVANGRIVGVLDIDTIGPGRRADDLACLIAHLSTIQGMNAAQAASVRRLLAEWVPVFDERVDPVELRLRAAAVIVSLATGPYRGQEPDWELQTTQVVSSAVALVRQVV